MEAQRFMIPPPPPPPQQQQQQQQPSPSHIGDPHHLHHLQQQQQQQPPRPPPPQGAPWYSGQFQFHASQPPSHQQQPPPPPPPMWGGSHPDHHQSMPPSSSSSSYPPPQHNQQGPPYPPHPHNHYLPPPPHPHHPYSHPHQAYPQTWQNQNQGHHQGWEHPDRVALHNNEEDWAAKAKAWAAANSSMENQHPQSQFTPVGRPEEHNHVYHDQYHQAVDPRYTDVHQPASNHQHFPGSPANPIRPPANHLQESAFNYGPAPPSEVPDGHMSYPGRDAALTADSNPAFPLGSTPANSSMYQQEVPSSYSSVPGKEGGRDQNEQLHRHSPLPMSLAQEGRHHVQPAPGRPASLEQTHFAYDNRSTDFVPDLCDRPLEFAPRFNREHDPYPQASYSHLDPTGTAGSVDHALTPSVGPGVTYPPIPPVPSGLQFDPSFVSPAIPGHAASMYGQIPGQNYRPNIPNVNAPFGLGSGTTLHPIAAFDVNGFSNISERPKKASVPNWLREEIIKKKAVITSSSQEFPERNPTNSGEEDGIDKSFTNGGQAGNRSTDSSRLSEDEDDDEDDVEAARTAAVNQEIKRVLTEVLLKVTDELFDEIATKVLSEDDLSVEVDYNNNQSNRKVSLSPSVVPTAKASAKVLIPVKGKETEADDASEKSSSGTPGDLLGLASYASDNDDDEEIPSSSMPITRKIDASEQKSSNHKLSENIPGSVENGNSQAETEGHSVGQVHAERELNRTGLSGVRSHSAGDSGSSDNESDKKMKHQSDDISTPFNGNSGNLEDNSIDKRGKMSKDAVEGLTNIKPELLRGNVNPKRLMVDESQEREARSKSDRSDDQEGKRNSADKDSIRGADTSKVREDEKHSHSSDTRRHDQRHVRKDKTNDRDGSKERVKDRGSKPDEKAKESDSRKRSKDDRKETENLRRLSEKEDSKRKRERSKDEKRDRSRHRDARDSSRHKKRRSSSIGSRGRHSKENSVGSHGNDSSDGASEDSSRRKAPPKKRSLSPSPTRSRRRQVSRSPHSKHSQRRHSPYSSLESTRRKRSRSKSPVHRRR